jgi:hypothetical protein
MVSFPFSQYMVAVPMRAMLDRDVASSALWYADLAQGERSAGMVVQERFQQAFIVSLFARGVCDRAKGRCICSPTTTSFTGLTTFTGGSGMRGKRVSRHQAQTIPQILCICMDFHRMGLCVFAASWFVARFGFTPVAYRGLEVSKYCNSVSMQMVACPCSCNWSSYRRSSYVPSSIPVIRRPEAAML